MKTFIFKVIILLIIFSSSGVAQDLSLDEILSKYYGATGIERMKDWQTLTVTAKTKAQGMELPVTMYSKRPYKIRTEVEIQGNKMLQVSDGQTGWSVVPWSGSTDPQDMTEDQVKAMKQEADFEGNLWQWKEKGHTVELLGKEDMEGTPVYKIRITLDNGNITTYYIDAENFVPLKTGSIVKIQGNETESDTYPGNYREVEGVMLPFTIETKFKGQTVSHVIIEKYEINREVSDSLFIKPVKKQ